MRQSETVVGTDAFVDQWNTYTPNGALFEESLPFKVSSEAFIPRSLFSRPLTHHEVDVLGRVVLTKAADGRDTRSRYAPQSIISFDARGTPSTSYVDALDRVIGVDESYRPAGSSDNYARERTTYLLDADGRVLSTTDADGNSRSLAYDQNGDVVSAQPFHKPGAVPSPYEYCFDGLGHELVSLSPSGVKVTSKLDSLGRAIERHYLPAAKFGGDDETYVYDDPLTPNGLGRLTASSNSRASISVDYDARGNVSQRTVKTMLGAAALPFTDGTFVSKMQFDALDRVIGEKPPWDPAQMDAPLALAYDYDERGNAKSIRQGSATLATVAPFSPSGKPLRDDLANGLTESYAYDPLNDRFTSSTVRHGTDPAILSYTVSYDAADNPKNVVRFWGTGLGSSDTLTKTFAFDSLNRLATASITGLAATAQQYQYAYSPAGNIRSKDGYSYVYGGDDPQAVTARTSPVTNANEHYGYDADGQLHTASPGHDGRQTTFGWDGAGRLVSASGVSAAGTVSSAFRYGPDGARLARSITGAHPASDIYIGSLELRHEGAGNTRRGYFNVAFGPVHLQLALKPGASGRLEADPTANRFYHLDYLGSTALVTSPAGTIVSNSGSAGRLEYAPYGEALATDDGAKTIRTRYTGKELDDETQLTYFGARYADLTLGRWISRDPLFISDAGPSARRPGSGLFTFVGGNPIARTDPDGRQECRSCDVASDSAAGGKFAKINAQASLKGAEINAIASGWLLFGLANPTGAMLSAVGLSQTSGASDAEGAALLGGLLLGKLAGVVGRTLSREVPAVTSAVAEGTAGTTAGARFAVTPKGVSVPTNPAELETSMQVLQETSTKPDVARKFVGADMRGNPVRVRIEKAHPEVPGYTGPKDPLHTVDHLHIDRRANGATGSWDSDEKLKYDWPF